MKKRIILIISFLLFSLLLFLVANFFHVRKQYKDVYVEYLMSQYGEDGTEISDIYFVIISHPRFNLSYTVKDTGEKFHLTINSYGEIIEVEE